MQKIMISYQDLADGMCGNQTFATSQEAIAFVNANKDRWKSCGAYTFTAGLPIADLTPVMLPNLPFPIPQRLIDKAAQQ